MEATLVDYPIDDEEMWDKYQLGKIAGGDFKTNTLVEVKDVPSEIATHEDPNSVFGPPGNTIPALPRRGVVFMACHNAIWEHSANLLRKGINPDRRSPPN